MMSSIFRVSSVNGVLLALYFIPAWTMAAWKIAIFPIRGIYDRANVAPAIFVSDYFQFFATGTVRFAWLLAIAKLLVVAFFAVFTCHIAIVRKSGDGDEALTLALSVGGLISFASMILAVAVGEAGAQHLHATETLLMLGGLVLLSVDTRQATTASIETIAIARGI